MKLWRLVQQFKPNSSGRCERYSTFGRDSSNSWYRNFGRRSNSTDRKNTTIPTTKSQVFSTAADSQPSVEVKIHQGERPMAIDNKLLGNFVLDGIAPAPRGLPQIEVSLDIDANGILTVRAKDKGTGKEQHITITGSSGLSKDEIEKMKKDAELYAEEDKKKKESTEIRISADGVVSQTERTLREHGDKVPAEVKTGVETKLKEMKDLLAATDSNLDAIKKCHEELAIEIQKIGSAMYQQPAGAPGAEGATGGDAGGAEDAAQAGATEDPDVKVYEKDKKPEEGEAK